MFRRTAAFVLLIWLFGFVWFAVALPGPLGPRQTDAAIVLTGSGGRIEQAIAVLKRGQAPRLLVSGVGREVKPREFRVEYKVPPRLMACCITLGYEAFDTRSNAIEAGDWVAAHHARTVRLITADWHMRRAELELRRELPKGVTLYRDAVPSRPSLGTLFLEYHKLLARELTTLWGA
ncbi:YdcF family protein [Novosphingobium sp. 9]|uniref:YdcF family protein n=1 Tax=Novosphingobium sp. 9 TaxID=2025349 RepID=UPI0021B4FBE1|nr:YdcF family protein [Novosphingobium sp. 9]